MELSQIYYFLDVARTEHMTKSAENLHIAQPSLTKSIHKLEDELGVPLFVQRGRNIVLTEYGRYLSDRLSPIAVSIDSIKDEIHALASIEERTVRINVLAASTLVTEAIILYQKDHPDVHFKLTQENENRSFDMQITTAAEPTTSRLCTRSLAIEEQIFLAVPLNSVYAEGQSIKLGDVRDQGFVSLIGSKKFREICDGFCRSAGFDPKIIFESDNPVAVRNMISANIGIGFWPEISWGTKYRNNIKLIGVSEPECKRDIIIQQYSNKVQNDTVSDFFDFLYEYFTKRIQLRSSNQRSK